MLNNNFDHNQLNSIIFTPKEKKLWEILGKIDPQLSDIFMGIFKTLSDIKNPDRFNQAANSIRGITNILIRNIKKEVYSEQNSNDNAEREEILTQLKIYFTKALRQMPVDSDTIEKDAQINWVNEKYKKLENALKKGSLTLKQELKRYFGNSKDLLQLPKFAKEEIKTIISIWAEANKYFVKLTHYDCIVDEKEFSKNWQVIQNCILKALSPFFDEVVVLDELLSLEKPPNE